jgi:RHS repeat-associated protein
LTADHLGSPRVITDQTGNVTSRHDYMAFGEEIARANYGTDSIRDKYTGYERDNESSLDYAQARYYNSRNGRFTSVDPLTASGAIANPQTFNRYSYVLNSPYKFTDPLGLEPIFLPNGNVLLTQRDMEIIRSNIANNTPYGQSILRNTGTSQASKQERDIPAKAREEIKKIVIENTRFWTLENGDPDTEGELPLSQAGQNSIYRAIVIELEIQFQLSFDAQNALLAQAEVGSNVTDTNSNMSVKPPTTLELGASSKDGVEGKINTPLVNGSNVTRTTSTAPSSPQQKDQLASENRGSAALKITNKVEKLRGLKTEIVIIFYPDGSERKLKPTTIRITDFLPTAVKILDRVDSLGRSYAQKVRSSN